MNSSSQSTGETVWREGPTASRSETAFRRWLDFNRAWLISEGFGDSHVGALRQAYLAGFALGALSDGDAKLSSTLDLDVASGMNQDSISQGDSK